MSKMSSKKLGGHKNRKDEGVEEEGIEEETKFLCLRGLRCEGRDQGTRNRELDIISIYICGLCRRGLKL